MLRPHDQLSTEEQAKGRFLAHIQAGLSAPRSNVTNSKSYFIFSTFYTTVVTIPFVVSITYWLVLHHSDPVLGSGAKCEALQRFTLISITTLNSAIALVEVMVLSSVRVQQVSSLSLGTYKFLKFLGSGHRGRWCHLYVFPIRDMDSLWPVHHKRICEQIP